MKTSQERFEGIAERTAEVMWRQWLTLGANLSGTPMRKAAVDPEALLAATATLGRRQVRLFDEAVDWLAFNYSRLSSSRLSRMMRDYPADASRTLAAVAEWTTGATGEPVLEKFRDRVSLPPIDEPPEAFWICGPNRPAAKPDPIYRKWGFLRGAPRLRRHSGGPDLRNEANVFLAARSLYGKGARADVLAYLCCLERGEKNSRAIAMRIMYDQKAVYRALEKLVATGTVENLSAGGRGNAGYYRIKDETALRLLGLRKRPLFVNWHALYGGIDRTLEDRRLNEEDYASAVLGGERAKELVASLVPKIRRSCDLFAEVSPPELSGRKPDGIADELAGFLERALTVVEKVTR